MNQFFGRVKEFTTKGKVSYQPQIKKKDWLSAFRSWEPLSLLVLKMDVDKETFEAGIKMWSSSRGVAEKSLTKFSKLFNLRIECDFMQLTQEENSNTSDT